MLDIQELQLGHWVSSKNLCTHVAELILLNVQVFQVLKPFGLQNAHGSIVGDAVVGDEQLLEVDEVV